MDDRQADGHTRFTGTSFVVDRASDAVWCYWHTLCIRIGTGPVIISLERPRDTVLVHSLGRDIPFSSSCSLSAISVLAENVHVTPSHSRPIHSQSGYKLDPRDWAFLGCGYCAVEDAAWLHDKLCNCWIGTRSMNHNTARLELQRRVKSTITRISGRQVVQPYY